MKILYLISPVPKRLSGWDRILRHTNNVLRGTLVIEFRGGNLELAN